MGKKVYMDNIESTESTESMEYMVEHFERCIINEYIQIDRFGVYVDNNGYIYLSDMYVKDKYRGQGVGGEVMVRLCEFADTNLMNIRCIPSSDDDGGGDERLLRFYGRYGFVVLREYGGCVVEMVRYCVKR